MFAPSGHLITAGNAIASALARECRAASIGRRPAILDDIRGRSAARRWRARRRSPARAAARLHASRSSGRPSAMAPRPNPLAGQSRHRVRRATRRCNGPVSEKPQCRRTEQRNRQRHAGGSTPRYRPGWPHRHDASADLGSQPSPPAASRRLTAAPKDIPALATAQRAKPDTRCATVLPRSANTPHRQRQAARDGNSD